MVPESLVFSGIQSIFETTMGYETTSKSEQQNCHYHKGITIGTVNWDDVATKISHKIFIRSLTLTLFCLTCCTGAQPDKSRCPLCLKQFPGRMRVNVCTAGLMHRGTLLTHQRLTPSQPLNRTDQVPNKSHTPIIICCCPTVGCAILNTLPFNHYSFSRSYITAR